MAVAPPPSPSGRAWPELPTHRAWLDAECRRLLAFGARGIHPLGGAAWLDDRGAPEPARGIETWLTARAVHVHALGVLLGVPGSLPLAAGALAGLDGPLRDREHGGWHATVDAEGVAAPGQPKSCYAHAFVVLAGATGVVAGVPGADRLLDEAVAVFEERFWDEDAGLCVDEWDAAWGAPTDYRGLNSTMHAVEAMLAAAGATGDARWTDRAARIGRFVVGLAAAHDHRLPEHFDTAWRPQLDYNRDRPDDPFRPFGATVGHGLEWSRLLLGLEHALGDDASPDLLATAEGLFARAAADGWAPDGTPGFVYTTDWDGVPVVAQRMHWVAAEAVAAAAALHARTGREEYAGRYASWWDFVAGHHRDVEGGSWHHELDAANRPVATVWPGKPDLYHAVQATLVPRIGVRADLGGALRDGLLR